MPKDAVSSINRMLLFSLNCQHFESGEPTIWISSVSWNLAAGAELASPRVLPCPAQPAALAVVCPALELGLQATGRPRWQRRSPELCPRGIHASSL